MRQDFLNRRIPTVFALVLLVVGIGVAVFVANNTTQFTGEAAPEDEPRSIQISNITDTSFTVSYTTDSDVLGSISYGTVGTDRTNVETAGTLASRTHVITLSNLSPNTAYAFTITSGSREYTDGGDPFVVTIASTIDTAPTEEHLVSGTILNPDGSPSNGALVYVTAENGSLLSTQTNSDGIFSLDVSSLKTADLSSYYSFSGNERMTLSAVSPTSNTKAVFLLQNADPLPTITLSQIYNFTVDETGRENQEAQETITFPLFREGATETQTITIISPETDEGLTDQQPTFEGTALPNEEVEIVIQSSHEIQTTVTTNDNGSWTFRPDTPLEPGNHTITVKTRDQNGILRILTRSFTVYAEGSQFTEPSVSPTSPTQTPSPTQSQAVSITPTPAIEEEQEESPTPTDEPTPTITPTSTPTRIPTPTITPMPTVEPTGSEAAPLALISSLGIVMAGAFVYLFSRLKSL